MTPEESKAKQKLDAAARAAAASVSQVNNAAPQVYRAPRINVPANRHEFAKLVEAEFTKIEQAQSALLSLLEAGDIIKTINGESPDTSGDVALSAEDVEALPIIGGAMLGPIDMGAQQIRGMRGRSMLQDHNNGNVTLCASVNAEGAAGDLFIGYNNSTSGHGTRDILLEVVTRARNEIHLRPIAWGGTHGILGDAIGVAFIDMRGAPVPIYIDTTTNGSSYAPAMKMHYNHNAGWGGNYSFGVLNHNLANSGAFTIHHIDDAGNTGQVWQFSGQDGAFNCPGPVTQNGGQPVVALSQVEKMIDVNVAILRAEIKAEIYTELLQAGILTPAQHSNLTERSTNGK